MEMHITYYCHSRCGKEQKNQVRALYVLPEFKVLKIFYNNDSVLVTEQAAYRSMKKKAQRPADLIGWFSLNVLVS